MARGPGGEARCHLPADQTINAHANATACTCPGQRNGILTLHVPGQPRSAGTPIRTATLGIVVRQRPSPSGKARGPSPSKPTLPLPPRFLTIAEFPGTSVQAEEYSRLIGAWGEASALIGRRWEELGLSLLEKRLPWSVPLGAGRTATITHLISVDSGPDAGPALHAAGVSAPDLLLLGTLGRSDRLVIQAADFKASLDTANPVQVSSARLAGNLPRLANEVPEVAAAVLTQAPSPAYHAALTALMAGNVGSTIVPEGLFIAPDSAFNRWLHKLLANVRPGIRLPRLPRGAPATRARNDGFQLLAHLEPVAPATMLGMLEGWSEAGRLAALDGRRLAAAELTLAERYWRLGAGLHGALRTFYRPVLAQLPAAWDATPALKRIVRRVRPANAAALLSALARVVEQRRPQWAREKEVLRCPVGFRAWLRRAEQAGLAVETGEFAGIVRRKHGSLAASHRERVTTAARQLHAQRQTNRQVLAALESRSNEWRAATDEDITAALAQLQEEAPAE